ncbi:arabinan endo-1,5-alpha-L-arabinosidase [Puia dinghuensis]|uniref:Extracellular endo-alpha-(1->5)-L-arabinanase 1 n=1 Tax=Puia dinghuensis TaxID=1792502 RepID=A0A8J2XSW8_9BACT|nr:arabinan endo-1,5-alpha-L-arabinosidase [Puia dinghuensis]GGA99329.1 extracellular endo-alpha-(1->5)-L-arabinanase 1 [Puia dinghuensis]
MGKKAITAVLLLLIITAQAQLTTAPPVHDPVMIRQDSLYYIFCTGRGISVWSSPDRQHWTARAPVFSSPPSWTTITIPGFTGHFWAPDISFRNGKYYLYYAVSIFGKNTSCIGLATNKTLDPQSPDFKWEDQGKIIQSIPGRDRWNAIDPNLIVDDQGAPWLDFGSFWDGIKLTKLSPDGRSLAEPQQWYTIASRHRTETIPDTAAGDAAIEAPFICKKDNYYYLFVSFDYCCRGEKSTYKMMVGRAGKIQGPYLDRDGTPMTLGGGSLVLEGDRNWNGVGHCAVVECVDGYFLVFHGYDAKDNGRSKLRIERLIWVDGWPVVVRQ